tara:strand:- start:712 stop:831 length:120 start_codon:yes stop_codon:yes gene_type:complete
MSDSKDKLSPENGSILLNIIWAIVIVGIFIAIGFKCKTF